MVALIPKPNKDTTLMKNLRPIAVPPVIYKWYSRCLGLLCQDELQKVSVFQTAFTPGRQAEEVLFTIRQLVEKNNEWKKDISICILDTDIAKAYDHVTFELVEKGLKKKGVPKPIIAAWLREWSQMKSTMCLNPETKSLPLSRGRSLLQGDPMAPAIFVACMDILLERFMEICKERGLGYHDEGLWLPVLVFADNIWLFAKTPKEIEHMFFAWIAVMRGNGLHTKTNECTWISTHNFPDQTITDETGERVIQTSGEEGFKALGAKITMVGDDNAEINNRLHKAWQSFYKHKSILCNRSTNVKKRLLLMERIISPGVFWGAGSWNLREQDIKKLQACQNTMHRMIVGMNTADDVHLDAALKKAYQEVHQWRKSANIDT